MHTVDILCCGITIPLGDLINGLAFREKSADQAVGVLIAATLPATVNTSPRRGSAQDLYVNTFSLHIPAFRGKIKTEVIFLDIMPIIQIAIGLLIAIGCISIAAHLEQKLREEAAYNALRRYEAEKAREADAAAAMQELDELEKELSEKSRE